VVEAIAILLGIGALIFVGYPLFKRELVEEGPEEGLEDLELQKLLSEKEQALAALKELDFDYQTGKLDEEDYLHLKDRYRAKALSLLKEIDQAGAAEDITPRCLNCGAEYEKEDKFCPSCGVAL